MRTFLSLLVLAAICTPTLSQTWATATSRNGQRTIVFRYVKDLGPDNQRSSQSSRIILVWRYKSSSGMPTAGEREQMDRLENLLAPLVERGGFATLALVSTGEELREWIYYARSEDEFLARMNEALRAEKAFPIAIHAGADPAWSSYERFRAGVRE